MSRTRFVAVLGIAMVALLVAGALIASNVGFRYNDRLVAAGSPLTQSATGTHSVCVPWRMMQKKKASDITALDTSIAEVSRFIEYSDTFETYTGRKGTPNPDFLLDDPALTDDTGQGLFVKVTADFDWLISGAHDPSGHVVLQAAGAVVQNYPNSTSATGTNFYCPPWHATADTAKTLMDDIGFANVAEVSRFVTESDAFATYTGRKGTPNADFDLEIGESYLVKMSVTVDPYAPTHY